MNNEEDYYKFYKHSRATKEYKNKQEINNLYLPVKKDDRRHTPIFYNSLANDTHQADSLFLPEDEVSGIKFKFLLVVVDIATRLCDAEPMTTVSAKEALRAIKIIYKRGILEPPLHLICDSGVEFQAEFQRYFLEQHIPIKYTLTGRSRQVALVEHRNQSIGTILHQTMAAKEMISGTTQRAWLYNLRAVINRINEEFGKEPMNDKELIEKYGDPWKMKQDIIPLGTNVRVALDYPQDVIGKRLHGTFRSSDKRWTEEVFQIKNYVLDPIQPVLYLLNQKLKPKQRVAYTRNQLQIVNDDEESPPGKLLFPNGSETYVVKKILGKEIKKGKVFYRVWWAGYKKIDATLEPIESLPKKMVEDYESTH